MPDEIKSKLAGDKEDLKNTEDESPETFINEKLWQKVVFKLLGYLAWIFAASLIVTGTPGVDTNALLIGVKMMILPLIWSAFEAQAMNRENQKRLKEVKKRQEENLAHNEELKNLDRKNEALKEEIYKKKEELFQVRAELNAKAENVQVLKESIEKANERIQTLEKIK